MGDEIIFGVPVEWALIIVAFWIMVIWIIFGSESMGDPIVAAILSFLTIGSLIVIGYFGWIILIPPALAIIGVAGFLVFRFLTR